MRTESEFISAIDCCFPYEDTALATSLIEEGCKLSPNAAYMVVFELAQRPSNSTTPDAVCLQLLDVFDDLFTHPLKELVLGIARRMICSEPIGTEECVNAMRRIGSEKGLYNALSIPYFAGYDENDEDKIDRVYDEIIADW